MSRSMLSALPVLALSVCLSGGIATGALGAPWWQVTGGAAGDHLGWSVAGVADLDNDGFGDVIVGAPDDDVSGKVNAGGVFVYSGVDGSLVWSAVGDTAGDMFGLAVAGVEDLDGDGFGDVIVGAPKDDPLSRIDAGSVYVYSGATGLLLWTKPGDTAGDQFGTSVAGVPDANGDGSGDVVVGAPFDDLVGLTDPGTAYVYSGATSAQLWKVTGTVALDHLGTAVGGVDDVNGDSLGDVIVGAPDDDVPGKTNAGSAYVHSGASGALLWMASGDSASDRFGGAVAGVLDLQGLGTHGVVVGANLDDPSGRLDAGSVYAFGGATGTLLWSKAGAVSRDNLGSSVAGGADVDNDGYGDLVAGAFSAVISGSTMGAAYVLSGQDGTTLFQVSGTSVGEAMGRSVSCVPDVDGDGRGDIVVGATGADGVGAVDAGRVSVYATQDVTADVTPPTIDCPEDLVVEATGPDGAVATFTVSATDDTDPAPTVTCSPESGTLFPLGATTVTCTAVDASGNESTCTFTVSIADTTAPTVACSVGTGSLWPPNHEMTDVQLSVSASDTADADVTVKVAVYSDEGPAADEVDASLDGSVLTLRSERLGNGDGRVFLVVVKATDAGGNSTVTCCAVYVAKSQSAANGRSATAQANSAVAAAMASGGTAPSGYVTVLEESELP